MVKSLYDIEANTNTEDHYIPVFIQEPSSIVSDESSIVFYREHCLAESRLLKVRVCFGATRKRGHKFLGQGLNTNQVTR